MPRRRIGMNKIREIIRYAEKTELSERQIHRALNVSRTVVAKYLKAYKCSGLTFERVEQLSDTELESTLNQCLKVPEPKSRYESLIDEFPYFLKELKRVGVTLHLLWEEYLQKKQDGYGYSQFCYHFQQWRKVSQVMMHQEYKPGEMLFVDFTGDKLSVFDPVSDKEQEVEVFVAILGFSGLIYIEAIPGQKLENWIRVNERTLWYFDGVALVLVPDNLRSAVTESNKYEPEINATFDDFAKHYGCAIIPARPYKPKDKALVENAVRLVYQRVYAPIRNRKFYSLAELNSALWGLLEEKLNDAPLSQSKTTRRKIFEELEKKTLKPLPKEKYPLKTIELRTVQSNYHILLREDNHYYSVPYALRTRGKKTQVKMIYDDRIIAIYYENVRVAQHLRDRSPNGYTTDLMHMPEKHRVFLEWTPERFQNWAAKHGENVSQIIRAILESCDHPQQANRSCRGFLSLTKKYGTEQLEKACKRAVYYKLYSYKSVKNILENHLEEIHPELQLELDILPSHENIRGSHYFN